MYVAQPIEWTERGVVMLDQRKLPAEEISYTYTDYREVAKAIREMVIRGAPAIGVAAAMGVALGVQKSAAKTIEELKSEFAVICETLAKTRPTAVDLFWALERMKARFAELTRSHLDLAGIRQALIKEAQEVHAEKKATDEAIGRFGAEFMPKEGHVMTQCNAGALATAGIGTALGVIRVAYQQGQKVARAGAGDAAVSAGGAADGVGIAPRRNSADGDYRQHGGPLSEDRESGSDCDRRGPHRGERRHGEQDRDVLDGGAGEGKQHSVLYCGADFHV